jgi:hypothetical protein
LCVSVLAEVRSSRQPTRTFLSSTVIDVKLPFITVTQLLDKVKLLHDISLVVTVNSVYE